MAEYDNKNSGTLFKNDKGDNPARPDYSGNVDVNGRKYRLAAWIKESKATGNKFLSLKFTEVTEPERPAIVDEEDKKIDDEIPDELPF